MQRFIPGNMPAGLPGSLSVSHVLLHPDRRNRPLEWPDPQLLSTNSGRDSRCRSSPEHRTRYNLSRPNRIDLRVHRNDAVSLALRLGHDAMAGTVRKVPESDQGNGSLWSWVTGI